MKRKTVCIHSLQFQFLFFSISCWLNLNAEHAATKGQLYVDNACHELALPRRASTGLCVFARLPAPHVVSTSFARPKADLAEWLQSQFSADTTQWGHSERHPSGLEGSGQELGRATPSISHPHRTFWPLHFYGLSINVSTKLEATIPF